MFTDNSFVLGDTQHPAERLHLCCEDPATACTTVLHVEDEPTVGGLIAELTAHWPEFRHVGVAATARDGLALIRCERPAIVLLDLTLPDLDGLYVAEHLRQRATGPRILAFTGRTDDLALFRLYRGLADGVVWKPAHPGQLRFALQTVAAGRRYFAPPAQAALERLLNNPDAFFRVLTEREQSLMPHFARRETDAQIAAIHGVGTETVRTHRKNVFQKLGVHNSAELQVRAREIGYR